MIPSTLCNMPPFVELLELMISLVFKPEPTTPQFSNQTDAAAIDSLYCPTEVTALETEVTLCKILMWMCNLPFLMSAFGNLMSLIDPLFLGQLVSRL